MPAVPLLIVTVVVCALMISLMEEKFYTAEDDCTSYSCTFSTKVSFFNLAMLKRENRFDSTSTLYFF